MPPGCTRALAIFARAQPFSVGIPVVALLPALIGAEASRRVRTSRGKMRHLIFFFIATLGLAMQRVLRGRWALTVALAAAVLVMQWAVPQRMPSVLVAVDSPAAWGLAGRRSRSQRPRARGARRAAAQEGKQQMLWEARRAAAQEGKQQMLWENYFPGYAAIRARYERTKVLLNARSKRMGMPMVKDGQELHASNMANPYIFCRKSFPPNGIYDQAEFHSCLQALNVPKVDLQNLGDSDVATDITGTPAGRHQPDGPGSLSPGSDGWSRW